MAGRGLRARAGLRVAQNSESVSKPAGLAMVYGGGLIRNATRDGSSCDQPTWKPAIGFPEPARREAIAELGEPIHYWILQPPFLQSLQAG